MRRLLCLAALGGTFALPLPAAVACSPARPTLGVDRDRVLAGSTLRVSGDRTTGPFNCGMGPQPPPASQVVTAGPVTPSDSPGPVPPLPTPTGIPTPFLPGDGYRPAARSATVAVTLRAFTGSERGSEPAGRVLARVAPKRPVRLDATHERHRFAATVTLPAGTAPGRYLVAASQRDVVFFGDRVVTVVAELPDSGAPSRELARLGLLAIVTGAVALAAGRRRENADTPKSNLARST